MGRGRRGGDAGRRLASIWGLSGAKAVCSGAQAGEGDRVLTRAGGMVEWYVSHAAVPAEKVPALAVDVIRLEGLFAWHGMQWVGRVEVKRKGTAWMGWNGMGWDGSG